MPLRLSFDALQVLDAIDRRGSFAAAAEALHRVPSAITYSVQKLEEDLDVLLFDRRGHRAQLTDAGRELLEQGRHLLAAAGELECRVKRIATGWETELRIAVDGLLTVEALFPLIGAFYGETVGTRLRLSREVLGGTWDALVSGRADLVIGATGDPPSGSGFATRPLGEVEFVFAVAPSHPLAREPDPLSPDVVVRHRAVVVSDTSRALTPRSSGLLSGQEVLAVPDTASKIAAQVAGLGCGYLPLAVALPHLNERRLIAKEVEGAKPVQALRIAWNPRERGKALSWFLRRLHDAPVREALFGGSTPGSSASTDIAAPARPRGRRSRS